jgi:hypothetical protein
MKHLRGTSVTVVLIGRQTANRPWVKYEIAQSIAQNNGLLGIHIHHLKTPFDGGSLWPGPTPAVPWNVAFPRYNWDFDLSRFKREIESAGRRSDDLRKPLLLR